MDNVLGQVRHTFIAEARELLQEIENALLALEARPQDNESINTLFRAVHTIKGSSGIVGMETVERFTHLVENLLSIVRDGRIRVTNRIIELLLESRDHIALLVELAAEEREADKDVLARGAHLGDRLNAFFASGPEGAMVSESASKKTDDTAAQGRLASTDAWHLSIRFGPDTFRSGMDPASFLTYLTRLGDITSLVTLFDLMPAFREMDPESCYLGFEIDLKSDFDKKTLEDVFEFVREDSIIRILPPHSRLESYIELINDLPEDAELLGEILLKGGALSQTELDDALRLQSAESAMADSERGEAAQPIGRILINEGMVPDVLVDAALEKQTQTRVHKSRESGTVRISAMKLDALVNLVGELVISSANVNQHTRRLKDNGLFEAASNMQRLVEDVRDTAMKLRMVPIGETFSRFNRTVRDISSGSDKEIGLVITGAETELDKLVVEKINDPLMHLVRNAADHGIEGRAERNAVGKPVKGSICLNACYDAGSVVITVSDDGRGLDREKIKEKAVSLGLIEADKTLSDGDIYKLIFEPGFSTAQEVTKLSGRGVGMDVVRRNIDSLRGTVGVDSVSGKGTTVSIRLPLTLAIIDGFMVHVAGSSYVIPLEMVTECVDLPDSERNADKRRGYINLRGEALPYIRLTSFFDCAETPGYSGARESIVIVRHAGRLIGLVVDVLEGEMQAVIKSLGSVYRDVRGISGATIMGDGTVALIVDVPAIVQTVEEEIKTVGSAQRT
ncbi:MAG: chemotaxis protein CheA [Deltaproteobacteria bacterium]|nr:chemotaxis protein CheA [Deltaproteobacteria bacterium]